MKSKGTVSGGKKFLSDTQVHSTIQCAASDEGLSISRQRHLLRTLPLFHPEQDSGRSQRLGHRTLKLFWSQKVPRQGFRPHTSPLRPAPPPPPISQPAAISKQVWLTSRLQGPTRVSSSPVQDTSATRATASGRTCPWVSVSSSMDRGWQSWGPACRARGTVPGTRVAVPKIVLVTFLFGCPVWRQVLEVGISGGWREWTNLCWLFGCPLTLTAN